MGLLGVYRFSRSSGRETGSAQRAWYAARRWGMRCSWMPSGPPPVHRTGPPLSPPHTPQPPAQPLPLLSLPRIPRCPAVILVPNTEQEPAGAVAALNLTLGRSPVYLGPAPGKGPSECAGVWVREGERKRGGEGKGEGEGEWVSLGWAAGAPLARRALADGFVGTGRPRARSESGECSRLMCLTGRDPLHPVKGRGRAHCPRRNPGELSPVRG